MAFRVTPLFQLSALAALALGRVSAQGSAPEIDELHRRISVIRAQLPQITALADKYATFLGRDSTGRLLISRRIDPAFFFEFRQRAGGPPDTQDSDSSTASGLALLPVRHWDGTGFGIAAKVEQLRGQARPVLLIGPARDRPEQLLAGTALLDDGASTGGRADAAINGVANMIIGWTFYAEVVAAATRAGWQPGIMLSVLLPGSTVNNDRARFRMPGSAPAPVAAGALGAQYLDAVDSVLRLASAPQHVLLVDSVATRIRTLRDAGATVYAGSCGHYLMEEIPHDAMASRTFAILPDTPPAPGSRPPARGDLMIWFGYGGYDCPNADVSQSFHDLGLRVVVVSDSLPQLPSDGVMAGIRLPWQLPDGIVRVAFPPGRLAPVSSVDMAVHYLWLRRLLARP